MFIINGFRDWFQSDKKINTQDNKEVQRSKVITIQSLMDFYEKFHPLPGKLYFELERNAGMAFLPTSNNNELDSLIHALLPYYPANKDRKISTYFTNIVLSQNQIKEIKNKLNKIDKQDLSTHLLNIVKIICGIPVQISILEIEENKMHYKTIGSGDEEIILYKNDDQYYSITELRNCFHNEEIYAFKIGELLADGSVVTNYCKQVLIKIHDRISSEKIESMIEKLLEKIVFMETFSEMRDSLFEEVIFPRSNRHQIFSN